MKNKLTLTLMCGIARCGKSTWIEKNAKNNVVICPDRIRKLIFGHQFHKDAEDFIWAIAKGMAKLILEQGKNVLIDATNVNYYAREQWYRIAKDYKAKIRVVWVKTSLEECKRRNAKSPKGDKLPAGVLDRMASMFENPIGDNGYMESAAIELIEVPYKGTNGKSYGRENNIYIEDILDKNQWTCRRKKY